MAARKNSTAVATQPQASVPALVNTPALELDQDDVQLQRIYFAHPASKQVEENDNLKGGMIFASTGEEDPDATILWDPSAKGDNPGVLMHVLGVRKGKSLSEEGDLQTWAFNDPDAPPEAWTTYNYLVALPEVDPDNVFKMLLTRTKTAAAKQINTVLKKNEGRGPAWNCAFRITSAPRTNPKGKYFVPRVSPAEATDENIATSAALAEMIASSVTETPARRSDADEPAI